MFRLKPTEMLGMARRFEGRSAIDLELHGIGFGRSRSSVPGGPFASIRVAITRSINRSPVLMTGYMNGWSGYVRRRRAFRPVATR